MDSPEHDVICNAHAASARKAGVRSEIVDAYSLLALLINSFDTDLPPKRTEPFLPV